MTYATDGDWLLHRHNIEVGDLDIRARAIQRAPSGVHARIDIILNGTSRAWSMLNIEKDEQRVRLANSAHKALGPIEQKGLGNGYLKQALDAFCTGLWEAHIGTMAAEELRGDPTLGPPTFTLHPYLLEAGGTILYAPPGQGKSTAALLMAASIHHGVSDLWPVKRANVMVVNIERSRESMVRRLPRINTALGIEAEAPLPFVNQRGRSLADIEEAIRQSVRRFKTDVVILDSISRAGMGKLIEDVTANKIVDVLNGLCPTWLAIAHTPRKDADHVFGSVHFEAGEDVGVRLTAQEVDNVTGIALEVTKANDFRRPSMEILAFEWLPDDRGLASVRKARRREFPELEAGKTTMTDEIADYVRQGAASATEIAAALGRHRPRVVEILRSNGRFCPAKKDGRTVLYGLAAEDGLDTLGDT